MNLKDVAYVTGTKLIVKYNSTKEYFAELHFAEIKDGGVLRCAFAFGKNPTEAKKNLAKRISGQVLVTNAYGEDRKEFNIPPKITIK